MRPIIVVIFAVVILGGVDLFLRSHAAPDSGLPSPDAMVIAATGEFEIELTLTCDLGADAFSLDDVSDAPSLLMRLNGQELVSRTDHVAASETPLRIGPVEGMTAGVNELYVQASPTELDIDRPCSIRIRVMQDGSAVAEKSIWPVAGSIVQDTLLVEVNGG